MEVSEDILVRACKSGCPNFEKGNCPFGIFEKDSCPRVREEMEKENKKENI